MYDKERKTKNKSNITKRDDFFILCSDLIPYDTPISFHNRNIYKMLKDENYKRSNNHTSHINKNSGTSIATIFSNLKKDNFVSIPYKYPINKNRNNEKRILSVMHPLNQYGCIDFYKEYQTLMLYYCSKSSYSIRYPAKKNNKIYHKQYDYDTKLVEDMHISDRPDLNDINKLNPQEEEKLIDENLISLYFHYNKYHFLYSFFDKDYKKYENQYDYLYELDISNCFGSIYTHSIAWSIHGKEFAKEHLISKKYEDEFSNKFDKIMRDSNDGETNGILIGNELSRIFAEIILQKVDSLLEERIKKEHNKEQYKICRYVDNYYIFHNNQEFKNKIKEYLTEFLYEYKLTINENKIKEYTLKPFLTPISNAKINLKTLLEEYLKKNIKDKIDKIKEDQNIDTNNIKLENINDLINNIRSICYTNKIYISDISSLLLSIIKNTLGKKIYYKYKLYKKKYDKQEKDKQENDDENEVNKNINNLYSYIVKTNGSIFINCIELSFYLFSNTYKQSGTTSFFNILILIDNIFTRIQIYLDEKLDEKQKLEINILYNGLIKEKIKKNILQFIDTTIINKNSKISTEMLDILQICKCFKIEISGEKLKKIFQIDQKNKISYFDIVSLLDYMLINKDQEDYIKIIDEDLVKIIDNKFINQKNPLKNTELFLLYFDLVAYVKKGYMPKSAINNCIDKIQLHKKEDLKRILNRCKNKKKGVKNNKKCEYEPYFFYEWDAKFTIDRFELEKQKHHFNY